VLLGKSYEVLAGFISAAYHNRYNQKNTMKNRKLIQKQIILFFIDAIIFISVIAIFDQADEIIDPFFRKYLNSIGIVLFIIGFILTFFVSKLGLDFLISEGWFAPYSTKKEEKSKFHCNKCNKEFASEDIQGDVCPFCRE